MRAALLLMMCLIVPNSAVQAQTQQEINWAASKEYTAADEKLNSVYQQILCKYAKNPIFIKNLKLAQRLWVQLRDTQLAMMYPQYTSGSFGSIIPMCVANYLAELTITRTKELGGCPRIRYSNDYLLMGFRKNLNYPDTKL